MHRGRRQQHDQAPHQADDGDARDVPQGRDDQQRTDTLAEQVEILESLLPAQLSGETLVALIEQTIAEVGATTRKDMGHVMGALNKATGGNFDKAAAAKEVGARLA